MTGIAGDERKAAQADPATSNSKLATFFFLIWYIFFLFIAETRINYERKTLISIGEGFASAEFFGKITAYDTFRPFSKTNQRSRKGAILAKFGF